MTLAVATTASHPPSTAHLTYEEHRVLERKISTLGAFLHEEPLAPDPEWLLELGRLLEDLASSLESHFAGEEESNLFIGLPLETPRFAAKVERFGRDHEHIRGEIRALLAIVRGLGDTHDRERLVHRVRGLLLDLKTHEQEENEVLQAAYQVDMAAGD